MEEPVQEEKWQDQIISEDIRNNPDYKEDLYKYKSADDMYKSLREAQSLVSKKGVIVPGENASEEEINQFYNKLGRPEAPDKYELNIDPELKEALDINEEGSKKYLEQAYKIGLNNKQANDLNNWYLNEIRQQAEAQKQREEEAKKQSESELRNEWGQDYEAKDQMAKKAFEAFGKDLVDENAINDPAIKKMFQKIGSVISEDALKGFNETHKGQNAQEGVQKQINDILADNKHPYLDENNPQHGEWVGPNGKMAQLYKQLNQG